jgi:hypothetical protein
VASLDDKIYATGVIKWGTCPSATTISRWRQPYGNSGSSIKLERCTVPRRANEAVYYDEQGLASQEEKMRSLAALSLALFSVTSAIAHEQDQAVSVGPWTIATSFKAERFDSCTMSRSANDLNITFVRSHDGLLLLLDSSKWKLDRGKAYDVALVANSRSVQAKALAETKSVAIALPDRPLGERVRTANILEVKGEGATLRVPLDASAVALERLDSCFEKNSRSGVESNPFVAPSRKP